MNSNYLLQFYNAMIDLSSCIVVSIRRLDIGSRSGSELRYLDNSTSTLADGEARPMAVEPTNLTQAPVVVQI